MLTFEVKLGRTFCVCLSEANISSTVMQTATVIVEAETAELALAEGERLCAGQHPIHWKVHAQ